MRLDHLLSKEHTPRCQANVLARMVVFTSGIVDGQFWLSAVGPLPFGRGLVVGGWFWLLMALRWWGMGSSTLLGPEGSAAGRVECWPGVWLGFWSSLCCCALCASGSPCGAWGWGVVVLVGLLFEICIVDASIL